MKKILPLVLVLSTCFCSWAQGEGIEFVQTNWKEALAKAAAEDKVIFLDAYTTWCAPCKKMDREVFSQKAAGDYFNTHFVNVKMDMEKGEGLEIAAQYDIKVYPSLLFVAPNGTLLHRAAGFHTTEQFVALGNIALDPQRRLGSLEERFAKGERDPNFLLKYTVARAAIQDGSHLPVLEAYFETQEDWGSVDNLPLIFELTTDANSPLFDYLVTHKQPFIEQYGERAVTSRIQDLVYQTVYDTKEESSLEQVDRLFAKAYPEKAKRLSANFRMSFYRQAGDRQNYAKAAVDYFDSFPNAGADELNDVAWTFYQVIDDKKLLKHASKWAKRSVKLDPQYYNNDTLAGIYQKMGKKKKAIKAAEMAIAIAKHTGEDYSNTAALLEELKRE